MIKAAFLLVVLAASSMNAAATTIIEAAEQSGDFTTLLTAGKAAGIDKALRGQGPFTLFAPTDQAFAKVPRAKLDDLLQPANVRMLKTALGAHLVTGRVPMNAIEAGLRDNGAVVVATINNMPLVFKREGAALTVNGATITKAPLAVANGLVYVIDAVLLPPMPFQPEY